MNKEKFDKTVGESALPAAESQKVTIRLTDRSVRISDKSWELLADVRMPIFRVDPRIGDGSLLTAIQAELDAPAEYDLDPETGETVESRPCYVETLCRLRLRIRKHADGRILLYGVREVASEQAGSLADDLGGELLASDQQLVDSLKRHAKMFVGMCGGCRADAPEKLVQAVLAEMLPECLDDDEPREQDSEGVFLNGGRAVRFSLREWPSLSAVRLMAPNGLVYERLVVRQQAAGRVLVYGDQRFADFIGRQEFNIFCERGGELLPSGGDLVGAIKRVGSSLRLSSDTVRACINGLPAEDLD